MVPTYVMLKAHLLMHPSAYHKIFQGDDLIIIILLHIHANDFGNHGSTCIRWYAAGIIPPD